MRCSTARKLISESIDASLDPKRSAGLRVHLDSCEACRKMAEDFEVIVDGAKRLTTPEPSAFAWQKIQAGLNAAGRGIAPLPKRRLPGVSHFSPGFRFALSTLAALVFVAAGVIFVLRPWHTPESLAKKDPLSHSVAKLEEAQRYYQLAIKSLGEALEAQKGNIDAEVAKVFQTNLQIIDSSIDACREAIEQEPRNLNARNLLLAAYQEKLGTLNDLMNIKSFSSEKRKETTL